MRQHQKFTASEQQIFSLGRILQILREEDNAEVLIEKTISYLKEQFDYSLIWIAFYDRLNHILFGKGGATPDGNNVYLQQRVVLSPGDLLDRKSTRLNSSHTVISYAVFCLKKKKHKKHSTR